MSCGDRTVIEKGKEMKVILASGSPRRRELLAQIGIEFDVMVSDASEDSAESEPEVLVQELSGIKAGAVYDELIAEGMAGEDFIVIGADTVVAYRGRILGKPRTENEAKEFLDMIQDDTHEVYTGVTLLRHVRGKQTVEAKKFCEETKVHFAAMSNAEIDEYVSTGDCMDKAGAYGIQGLCARYIRGIEGDYNNVVGLPVARLYFEIKEWLQ